MTTHIKKLDILNGKQYINKSTKALRHFLYTRGWKQTAKGSWRSAYSPIAFDNINDVIRFDAKLRAGLSPKEAYASVPKFTYERTHKEINKRRNAIRVAPSFGV